jgi:hypothetical protein
MPPLPDAPNVVRLKIVGSNNGTGWLNGFYLRYAGAAPSNANLDALCSTALGAYATNFLPLCNNNVALSGATAQDLTNAASSTGSATNTSPGTRGAAALTSQAACVVSWKINVRYRGGHPRTYLPAGITTDLTAGHLWTGTFVTAAVTAALAFRTALNGITVGGATWSMIALSYHRNNVALNPPVPYTIQTAQVHGRVDTQRSRLGAETP